MNKPAFALVMLLIGLGAGWVLRDNLGSPSPRRARAPGQREREADSRLVERREVAEFGDRVKELPEPATEDAASSAGDGAENATEPASTAQPEPEPEGEEKKGGFWQAQIPQAKEDAEKSGREKGAEIGRSLGIDAERAAQMGEVFARHSGEMTERIMTLLFGEEEIDELAFQELEDGLDFNVDLERDLSLFLSDEEVLAVRREMDAAEAREKEARVDGRIEAFALPELSERQREEVREVLRQDGSDNRDPMLKAMRAMFREPEKAKQLADDKEFIASLRAAHEGRRERLKAILSKEQFSRYEAWERRDIANTRMGVRMMGMISQLEGLEPTADGDGSSIRIGVGFGSGSGGK